ncbi:Elongation factor P [bacterium HR40]|nr:Elongation factor P [bacterium HR40]
MKISVNDMKPGMVIEHRGRLWRVVKTEHVKPGKGPAYQQVELKGLPEGTKLNERFRAADSVERVRLEETPHQFLYDDGERLHFLNQETFDEVALDRSLLGERAVWLEEGMVVNLLVHEGRPIDVELPETVVRTVVQADPVVKGQTAAASYKPAVLDNGVRIMVPPHIESGARVVVDTRDGTYVERARE